MSMNPVVLLAFPSINYMIGTFDTTKFKSWWRSNPFPESIDTIKKGFHIYGRTHLALAKRTDGRWAVYRSKNYGIDWERAWLAASGEIIYDIVLITYGRAILNTSKGFYETVNAGKTWTLILSLPGGAPNAPAFCNIGGGDVLLCTNGRYIWRSTNLARSWTQVCDMQTIAHYSDVYYPDHFYYTGPSNACIAGACGRVYAAHGPFLVVSNNAGMTWARKTHWEGYTTKYSSFYPPSGIVHSRLWPGKQTPKFLISQILITSVDGPTGDDVCFLVRTDDLYPVTDGGSLYNRVFVTYSATYADYGYIKNYFFRYKYHQPLNIGGGQNMDSHDVAVLGANYNDKMIFSAQEDESGLTLKYSIDGGANWIDIDVNKIKVGDPEEGGSAYGSMVDDNYVSLSWHAPACNNVGHYDYIELKRRQCQSYEMDALVEVVRESSEAKSSEAKSYDIDSIVEADGMTEESVDAILEANLSKAYDLAAYVQGIAAKSYRIDRTCEGTSTKEQELDALVEKDQPVTESVDAVLHGRPKRAYLIGVYLRSKRSAYYLCDTILVEDTFDATVQNMIAKFPQFMDLVDPGMPYEVYNSRKVS